MKTSDFYYDLPKELIAQTPAPVRSQSRLLIYNRGDGSITDGVFTDVLQHLHPGDVLVRNNTPDGSPSPLGVASDETGQLNVALSGATEESALSEDGKEGAFFTSPNTVVVSNLQSG